MNDKGIKKEHFFSSDRPINSCSEDLLGRVSFSEKIAKAISNWSQEDSLVLGISANWGDGKTSVKNMIVEKLNNLDQKKASKIIEFNPWQWQDQNKLLEAFFNEVQIQLGTLYQS